MNKWGQRLFYYFSRLSLQKSTRACIPVLHFNKALHDCPKKLLEEEGYLKAEGINKGPIEEFLVNIGIIEQKQQLEGG